MGSSHRSAPPPFVRLAAHPVRWRLLGELARTDLRVRELVALVDLPQSLVSYHLSRLRAEELVRVHRSSFDARDSYYQLDLARCADTLAAAGSALHPGLRLAPAAPATTRAGGSRPAVLFLCTGNSARSPIAEALLRLRAGSRVEVASAGSHPKTLHPLAVRVLREEYGVDLAGRVPRSVADLAGDRFDYVVTLCDRLREVCPEVPDGARRVHWSTPDPSTAAGAAYDAFRRIAAELDSRIGFLLPVLTSTTHLQEVP
jgi:ArsR family transcriptional regulator, arsenate/arsenite/antimonite-responsive transcriptional repressor / arsenate reductase (thioredoxin)